MLLGKLFDIKRPIRHLLCFAPVRLSV
jgi:hypothetical protein